MSMNSLLDALAPILPILKAVDLSDPGAAAALNARLPIGGADLAAISALVTDGIAAGWLCPRDGGSLTYGRAAKAGEATRGFGIYTVDMTGPGPGHTHPNGEIDLCFALEGAPTFDGNPPGWTVYPAGSWHVPTVRDGRMGILYFLPDGAIRFERSPAS